MGRPIRYTTKNERSAAARQSRARWRAKNPERQKEILRAAYQRRKSRQVATVNNNVLKSAKEDSKPKLIVPEPSIDWDEKITEPVKETNATEELSYVSIEEVELDSKTLAEYKRRGEAMRRARVNKAKQKPLAELKKVAQTAEELRIEKWLKAKAK